MTWEELCLVLLNVNQHGVALELCIMRLGAQEARELN